MSENVLPEPILRMIADLREWRDTRWPDGDWPKFHLPRVSPPTNSGNLTTSLDNDDPDWQERYQQTERFRGA